MCNYLLLRPVCPTCLRIRLDGPPTDPLIADPTPISICDTALSEQRICHSDSPNTLASPSNLNIIGSEQCSTCEQAQAQLYLPSATSREIYASGLIEELDELDTLDWPNEVRTRQTTGSRGHLLRVIWERQSRKRDRLEQGMRVPILDSGFAGTVPSVVTFSAAPERKEKQKTYFKRLYEFYSASVYALQLPERIQLADVTKQDAILQIGRWEKSGDVPSEVAGLARIIFKNLKGRLGRIQNGSGICFLVACVGLAFMRLESTQTQQRLAQMAGLEDLNELRSVYAEIGDVYTDLMNVELESESERPSVLDDGNAESETERDRRVRFRSPTEEDVVVFSPTGSSPPSSPTNSTFLEAFMKSLSDSEASGEYEDFSDRTEREKCSDNSSADKDDGSAEVNGQNAPEICSELSKGTPSDDYYRLLPDQPKIPRFSSTKSHLSSDLPGKAAKDSTSTSATSSLTQQGAKMMSNEGSMILQLAEIPAASFVKPCRWKIAENRLLQMFYDRLSGLRLYNKVSRPKFPEGKWYRHDALMTAVVLLDDRYAYMQSFEKEKKIPVLPPSVIKELFERQDEVLYRHIQCAVELSKQLKKDRTDLDTIQYMAHVLSISCEMGRHALKKLVKSDMESKIIPSEQEWAAIQAYQMRGYSFNQPNSPPGSESSGLTHGTSEDSDTPGVSYTQLWDKAVHFYQLWTAEWIEMAKQLQKFEPVRRILKVSSTPSNSNKRKRLDEELGDTDVQGQGSAPKRVRRKSGGDCFHGLITYRYDPPQ